MPRLQSFICCKNCNSYNTPQMTLCANCGASLLNHDKTIDNDNNQIQNAKKTGLTTIKKGKQRLPRKKEDGFIISYMKEATGREAKK